MHISESITKQLRLWYHCWVTMEATLAHTKLVHPKLGTAAVIDHRLLPLDAQLQRKPSRCRRTRRSGSAVQLLTSVWSCTCGSSLCSKRSTSEVSTRTRIETSRTGLLGPRARWGEKQLLLGSHIFFRRGLVSIYLDEILHTMFH